MIRVLKWAASITAALLVSSPLLRAQDLLSKMDQYMKVCETADHFMGSVLVARHGKVILSQGYGWRNVKLQIPDTPETEFPIASITKEFTAMAILELQEQGKLNVQDPVCQYVPNCPAAWAPITLSELLTHTSGIPDFAELPSYTAIQARLLSPPEVVRLFENQPLAFKPGKKFSYSNSGYVLLGIVIERASGQSYPEYLAKNIFAPLGMAHTGYDGNDPLARDRARGYVFSSRRYTPAQSVAMTNLFSAGALYSTVEDLYKWDRAVESGKLIPPKLRDEMLAPQVSMGKSGEFHYGFGWIISTEFGQKEISHGGGVQGFTSLNAWFPHAGTYIIVLDNSTVPPPTVSDISQALAAILFRQPYRFPGNP
ncbi:MAG: serine hydrolase domain-containing protein [Terracidiphilus sp.]